MNKIIATILILCASFMAGCGDDVPEYIDVDAEIVEVYKEGGVMRITKTWRTSLRTENGTVITRNGKLGKKGDKVKITIRNPEYDD